jgi:uncharacterized protein (DUF2345 family)
MPSPKSGKAGSAVSPADSKQAEEADKANPGEVEKIKAEQLKTKSGKYGSEKVKPHKPPKTPEEKEKKKSWIEIELVDTQKQPVPGERYKITLPDKTVAEGVLDGKGFARIEGIEPGTCEVTFPEMDGRSWSKA